MNEESTKTVAIIGRPNVGKSTLFNRLVGKRISIETPIAGTTRDRLFGDVNWQGNNFNLIDVAGIENGTRQEMNQAIQRGIEMAIAQADLILFLVDWDTVINEDDLRIARRLRRLEKPIFLVINKADNLSRQSEIDIFKRLGNFPIFPVSAISGSNTGDLLDAITKKLNEAENHPKKQQKCDIRLAIIGRPNVGKSTLLNAILKEERSVVSAEQGTTRDIIDATLYHKGKRICITDTAGIRRPGKIGKDSIESFSVIRTLQALKRSDIALLVIDGLEGLVALDANILGRAKEWGKGIILAVNKIDVVSAPATFQDEMLSQLRRVLNFAPWITVVFISAKEGDNLDALLNQIIKVAENRATIIPPEYLNKILDLAKIDNSQLVGLKTLIQEKSNPPIFKLSNKGSAPHYTQLRYLENKIRDHFPMNGTPIFIDLISRRKR